MHIIGLKTIASYINRYPEAKTDVISWLKCEDYRAPSVTSIVYSAGGSGCFYNKHFYRGQSNFPANAHWLNWMGNAEEEQELRNQEQKKFEGKTVTVKKVISVGRGSLIARPAQPPLVYEPLDASLAFETEADYDDAFITLTELIKAEPGTAAYNDLLHLILRIRSYETYRLPFPTVTLQEMVNARMDELVAQVPELYDIFAQRVGPKFGAFLAGEQQLPPYKLKPLLKSLGLQFPIDDRRFMA